MSSPPPPTTARRSWAAWRVGPRAVVADVLLWLLCLPPAVTTMGDDGPFHVTVAAMAALVALALLLLRRRRPVPVLGAGLATMLVATAIVGRPTALVPAVIVLLFAVAVRFERRIAIWAGAVGTACVLGAVVILRARNVAGPELLAGVAWPSLAVAAGDAVRSRREAIGAAEERARRAEESREEEARRRVVETRLQIARELHDVVAHRIAVINVQAGVAAHLMTTKPDDATTALATVRSSARQVLDELADILGVLRDADDDGASTAPAPTLDDLPPLIASFDGAGLRVVYETSGTVLPLGDRPTIALYRTVQEALTNAHKHGDGAATVRLAHHADEVEVEITNRVAAGPTAAPASGFGLVGMRERVQSAGGRLTTGARPEGTFVVHARFPRSRMQESS